MMIMRFMVRPDASRLYRAGLTLIGRWLTANRSKMPLTIPLAR
jgi:hypothetical protein